MSSPSRPRRRDAVANREALLEAAARVFRTSPNASLDAIAHEAGLTRRAVYGHFASRDEMLAVLVDRGAARISAAVQGVRDDDPALHIARIGAAVWQEIAHVKLVARMIVRSPLDRTAARGLELIRRSLRDGVTRGAQDGSLRRDADPEVIARLIESSALAVLDTVVTRDIPDDEAQRLVITTALGIAGLSWRDADAAIRKVA
ncbi:TetR/AcrR family transcriptional regulator [Microbacterium amylolyticum]|uniref:AcrR family transcriptional regulator n=1 Tax=Microbacterium amylolyticum TaxID=936337 RepID=A0ABS4ZIB0_9MICO|nr:TetR/AcrR family transcriptional regulator [Microbacterium amylolyticum]MBP2437014.1 AcrR family transcriptional regulator [Microbacterium amylolyticum]